MAWCLVKKSTGTTLLLPLPTVLCSSNCFQLDHVFDSHLLYTNACVQMDLVALPADERQPGLQGVTSDTGTESPSPDGGVIVMRREASPRLQPSIEFPAPCSGASSGYEFQTLQPIRSRNDGAEPIIVQQEVRAETTEHNASLERHLVTIQTLPNTAWRMASTQLERGSILLNVFMTWTLVEQKLWWKW
jgi:hypothetical protein